MSLIKICFCDVKLLFAGPVQNTVPGNNASYIILMMIKKGSSTPLSPPSQNQLSHVSHFIPCPPLIIIQFESKKLILGKITKPHFNTPKHFTGQIIGVFNRHCVWLLSFGSVLDHLILYTRLSAKCFLFLLNVTAGILSSSVSFLPPAFLLLSP